MTQSSDMVAHALPIRLVIASSLLVLSACSGGGKTTDELSADAQDPPGAAQALSIGRQVAGVGDGEFETAVNCAAALGITAERLAQMSSNPQSREIALMARAEDYFEARAGEAGQAEEEAVSSPAAAIARRRSEKADETSEQAQLAIACLRRFGDDVSGATGADVEG